MIKTPHDLKAARRSLGLSVKQLGELLETDPTTVRRWEMSSDKNSAKLIPESVGYLLDCITERRKPILAQIAKLSPGPIRVLLKWNIFGKAPKLPG